MPHPDEVLAGLLPDVAAKCRQHVERAAQRGLTLLLTSGWRSPEEQVALFTKGRACVDGVWSVVDPHRVVTDALPEAAPHCRGAAYDIVPIVNEIAAWDRLDMFQVAGELGEALGLHWGGRWPKFKDLPHFELPGWRALPLKVRP